MESQIRHRGVSSQKRLRLHYQTRLLLSVVLLLTHFSGSDAFALTPHHKAYKAQPTRRHFVPQRLNQDEDKMQSPTVADLSGRRFYPFDFPPSMLKVDVEQLSEETKEDQNGELNIWAARGLLLLVSAIFGTNFASVKYLENLCFSPPCNHLPSEAALARFGLAAAVSLPLLINQRWGVVKAGLECGLWIALGYVSQAMALSTIDSGKCAFICSLTVVFVPVLSAVLYGKEMKGANILAALVALAGVGVLEGLVDINALLLGVQPAMAADTHSAILVTSSVVEALPVTAALGTLETANAVSAVAEASTGPLATLAQSLGVSKGDILALGQPIGFGTAFTRVEQYQEELKDVPNRVLTIAAAQCVAVGVFSFFWVLYDFHGVIPDMGYMIEPHSLATIFWTGIVTTVVAIYVEGIALQKATATEASLAYSTEPVWASLFGFLLLHETIGNESYVGGSIILIACLIGAVSDIMAENNEKTKNDNLG